MTERALTAEERDRVQSVMLACHESRTAQDGYDAVVALVRENGDLRAQVAWLERQDMTVREVIPPAQAQALKDAEAALARMREALEGACLGADFAWGDPPTPVLVFAMKPDARVHAKMSAEEIVGVLADGARALAEEEK